MQHILDNPIWYALNTGNKKLSNGDNYVKYLKREAGLFAGLRENSSRDLFSLFEKTALGDSMVLFVLSKISVPRGWQIMMKKPLLQMVYLHKELLMQRLGPVELTEKNVPAMLSLTALTEPGPFLPGTIEFGNYQGIFEGGELIAMAGQRLQPYSYVEISAVCTHPDYTGKGYASLLIANQISNILKRSCVPFLHVLPENHAALSLYRKLGFEVRKEMLCYVLRRL